MTNLGFKKLTTDNWLEPDKISTSFVRISPINGQFHSITNNEWVQEISKPNLIETVPVEIQRLFEVARGALAYGYFFYPLYTLAGEQLFRVAEGAIIFKCKTMGAPNSINTFQKKVEWLIRNGIIPKHEKGEWDAIRKLRNIASHPENQTILPPGPIISMLQRIAEKISFLFSGAVDNR